MKKVIGIYYKAKFNDSSFETGCGGSDAWVIQISRKFVQRGFHVIVFSDCGSWELSQHGVEYVPIRLFEYRCSYQHFDYFIMTRCIYPDLYDKLVASGCKNIYVQSHDMFLWLGEIYYDRYWYDPTRFPHLKYVALTEFHQEELHMWNQIPYDKIEIIGNGLDSDVFDEVASGPLPERDNSILFPSVYTRGGDLLVERILLKVQQFIPDFRVRLCGYADVFPENVRNNPSVDILGMLSKKDFFLEFFKHKVWFLPCVVPEDFGLCVCEAVMCGCEVVSTFKHGMKDVCYPFVNLAIDADFKVVESGEYHRSQYKLDMNPSEIEHAVTVAAMKIVDSIKNYDNPERRKMRESFKNFLVKTHTWENVVKKWENLFAKSC